MKMESMNHYAGFPLLSFVIAGVVAMASSASVNAQTVSGSGSHQVTRAEVRHELEELEAAGYNPSMGDDASYPADLQAAQAKVAARHRAESEAAMSGGRAANRCACIEGKGE